VITIPMCQGVVSLMESNKKEKKIDNVKEELTSFYSMSSGGGLTLWISYSKQ